MLTEAQFPLENLRDSYGAIGAGGLPERELRRFEVFDGADLYRTLDTPDLGSLHVVVRGHVHSARAEGAHATFFSAEAFGALLPSPCSHVIARCAG